jgi:hypothetical protein
MLAKSLKVNGYIMMVQTGRPEKVTPDGETASAKRTQRTMQAAGGLAVLQKLTQPRNRKDADGDVLRLTEARMEGAQEVCSGRSVGVPKTVACIEGSELELGRPDCFLARGSRLATKGRGLR